MGKWKTWDDDQLSEAHRELATQLEKSAYLLTARADLSILFPSEALGCEKVHHHITIQWPRKMWKGSIPYIFSPGMGYEEVC